MKVMMLSSISSRVSPSGPSASSSSVRKSCGASPTPFGHARRAHLDRVFHDAPKECHRLAAANAVDARQPCGRLQEIKRVDTSHRLKQPVDLVGKGPRLSGDLAGKQRLGQNVIGQQVMSWAMS
jgi:hypothetical protein